MNFYAFFMLKAKKIKQWFFLILTMWFRSEDRHFSLIFTRLGYCISLQLWQGFIFVFIAFFVNRKRRRRGKRERRWRRRRARSTWRRSGPSSTTKRSTLQAQRHDRIRRVLPVGYHKISAYFSWNANRNFLLGPF